MTNYRVISPKYIISQADQAKTRNFQQAVSKINQMLEVAAEKGYKGIQFYFWDYFNNLSYKDFENIKTVFRNAGWLTEKGKRQYDLRITTNLFADDYILR